MEFKEYSNCEKCIHREICRFKDTVKEALAKMNGHLDNLFLCEEPFIFSFECKEYKLDEKIIAEKPWFLQ